MKTEDWESAIRTRFSKRIQDACLKAFQMGVDHVAAAV
jgi:hypothetical protein